MTAALEVRDLAVHFPVRDRLGRRTVLRAVDGASLSLEKGRTLGLVGESGCGKTSLLRAILGLQKVKAGEVRLHGEDILSLGRKARRALGTRIQIVFQDPYGALNPRMTVAEIVAEPLRIHRRYDPARVARLLDQVGLGAVDARRRPAEFSGGQRQRIGIARALALEPDVLVLDEPVSALDVSVQAQVMNLLAEVQRDAGLAYLFIAHDLSVVRHMSHDVAVMYLGRIVESGPRATVFEAPAHPYTQALIDAAPRARYGERAGSRAVALGDIPDPIDRPSGCAFRTRCPRAQQRCMAESPPLLPHGAARHAVACWFPETGGG